ncbi:hypothetical protein FLP41_02650 (plasmid) [Paracoccus marcusii]|uniref:hypothetical protein n=1 Tax=Paracoccus marcusii TaxID=59779 RepID=UPI002ED204D7|nr:hypothetical protein FLP41_02650 [Paracoccus marcusii]
MAQHYDRDYPWHQYHGTEPLNAHLDSHHAASLATLADMDFDVIHNNTLHRFPPRFARAARVPMVTSLHVPPFDALRRAVRDSVAPWHVTTGCSRRHLAAYFPKARPHRRGWCRTASIWRNGPIRRRAIGRRSGRDASRRTRHPIWRSSPRAARASH